MAHSSEDTVLSPPESFEVVKQRVNDILNYVKNALPELFGTRTEDGSLVVGKHALSAVLSELDREWDQDPLHSVGLNSILAHEIAREVYPAVMAHVSEEMGTEEGEDFEDEINESAELDEIVVKWDELFPAFEGSIGVPVQVASLAVEPLLNAVLWDSPILESVAVSQVGTLPQYFDLYLGGFALVLLYVHVQVVTHSTIPTVELKYH